MQKNIWKTQKCPILALAPMAGYTDSAFRLLCLKNGADIVYTEMVSVEAIWRKNKKTLNMLKLLPQEKNVILQLFGSKPESFAKALRLINNLLYATGSLDSQRKIFLQKNFSLLARDKLMGIDINLGCPAKKVYRTGAGAALMNNKKLGREIIKTVLENTKLPVSIKIRSQVKDITAMEFIKYIKDLPISAVMIHGRSLKQGFSGPIDYEMIRNIKKILTSPNPRLPLPGTGGQASLKRRRIKIPVLANGGIYTLQEAKIMLEKTNADGLGIARGAWGRPWIFSSLSRARSDECRTESRDPVANYSWPQTKKIMIKHAELFLKYNNNLISLRKHLIHYTKGQKNASELRQKIIKIKTLEDLEKL